MVTGCVFLQVRISVQSELYNSIFIVVFFIQIYRCAVFILLIFIFNITVGLLFST